MTDARDLPRFAADWALFLDVDGTLAEIVDDPEAVAVDPRTIAALGRLAARLHGAVALISGRPIAVLDALFAPLSLPAAGLHGLERRDAEGRVHRSAAPAAELAGIRSAFIAFAADRPGLLVEDKGLTVALHYRKAPAMEAEAVALARSLESDAFRLQRGRMVVELRPVGPDKGDAIESFLAEPPFAGRRPVFAGDDVTDENGFAAVNRRGGHSIRIGAASATQAGFLLADVAALRDWLCALAWEGAHQATGTFEP